MTALQASIGALNDIVDAPRDRGLKPGKPIPAGLVSPRSAWAVVVVGGRAGRGSCRSRRGRRRSALAIVVLAIGYGYDLVFKGTAWSWFPFAIGIPLLPGLRLARDDGRPAGRRSRSCSPSPSSPARRWPSPTPGPMSSATPRPAWIRSRPGWGSSGRGPSTRPCWPSSSAWRSGRWWPAAHRRPPSLGAVGAGLVIGLGVALGRRADSARRERAWELEAVGVGLLAAAWLAGTTLGQ